jgi:DNA processing protein
MKEWIALNMTPGVGPRVATKLLERFGSPDGVFHARRAELESLRVKPATIESIIKREFEDAAEKELERVKSAGGDILILDDGSYPEMLREIADPPITLYVRGEWQACFEQPCVAVIGSRQCSTYGANAAEMLSRDLASRGVCVVSGLARGIDTAAHKGAIAGKGKTVAVLGTGLDTVYPKENARFVNEILDAGGAIVTQFPLGTPPLKDNFPYRNRIISGLSLGVLIIEASERSGSLITARLATEQNREVMAVPGNITSRNSFGTNYLIKAGAKLVQQWQDVVAELPAEIGAKIPCAGQHGLRVRGEHHEHEVHGQHRDGCRVPRDEVRHRRLRPPGPDDQCQIPDHEDELGRRQQRHLPGGGQRRQDRVLLRPEDGLPALAARR